MPVNKQQCIACINGYKICPRKTMGLSGKALQDSPGKDCMRCEIEVSLVDYYVKIRGVDLQDTKSVANDIIQWLTDAKRIEHEQKLKIKVSGEMETDYTKRLLISGGVWLGLFMAILYMLLSISMSNIHWLRFVALLLSLPLLFTLLGAFILKSSRSLKEESFVKLVTLTLKLNLKGLKSLKRIKKIFNRNTPTP